MEERKGKARDPPRQKGWGGDARCITIKMEVGGEEESKGSRKTEEAKGAWGMGGKKGKWGVFIKGPGSETRLCDAKSLNSLAVDR